MTQYFIQKRTVAVSLAMGFIGLGFGIIMYLLHAHWGAFYLPDTPEFLMAAFAGGCAGGMASAWAFGRQGQYAILFTMLGAVLATSIGAAVGGSLFAPGFGTFIGVVAVADALINYPVTVLPWAGMMFLLHLAISSWPRHLVAS